MNAVGNELSSFTSVTLRSCRVSCSVSTLLSLPVGDPVQAGGRGTGGGFARVSDGYGE